MPAIEASDMFGHTAQAAVADPGTPVAQFESAAATEVSATPALVAAANSFVVKTPDEAVTANEFLVGVNKALASLEAARKRISDPLYQAWKELNAQAKTRSDPLEQAKKIVGGKIIAFNQEQERLRRQEQERLQREADDQRRKDEAAAAETRRKADEAATELRRQAEAASAAGNTAEANKLEAKAERTVDRAEDKAQALEVRAATTVVPVVPSATPKLKGSAFRKVWKFRITKPLEVKREFLQVNETMVGNLVRSMGKQAEGIVGGIEAYEDDQLATARK